MLQLIILYGCLMGVKGVCMYVCMYVFIYLFIGRLGQAVKCFKLFLLLLLLQMQFHLISVSWFDKQLFCCLNIPLKAHNIYIYILNIDM